MKCIIIIMQHNSNNAETRESENSQLKPKSIFGAIQALISSEQDKIGL